MMEKLQEAPEHSDQSVFSKMNSFVREQTHAIEKHVFEESHGMYNRSYVGFKMSNVRRLPIVGDVHLSREERPSLPIEWQNLWSIRPLPVRLLKI